MDTLHKRFWLFLVGCIGTRVALVILAARLSPPLLRLMGVVLLAPAIGFFYLYATKSRQTGPEVFGDRIWWDDLRPIHGVFYLLFSLNAIAGVQTAWVYLLIDVVFGLIQFLRHHGFLPSHNKIAAS